MKKIAIACILGSCLAGPAPAQSDSAIDKILSRLDKAEEENRKLTEEIRTLRAELSQVRDERVAVQEQRSEELALTKVQASQRLPLSLTGMLLFNAFHNGRHSGTSQYPVSAANASAPEFSGASLRQTVLGLSFDGPALPWGGKASGSLYMDFFAGTAEADNNLLRIRVATVDLAWKNTTVTIGQDKPLVAQREPDSLAQIGISPLTGAGNLWNWQPQVRIEHRVSFGENTGLRAQGSVYQTNETDSNVPAAFAKTLERARPGYEGRLEFWHRAGEKSFEFAPGYHASTTHVGGTSVPSNAFTLDGLARPFAPVQITGAFFRGENLANLGTLRQGFTFLPDGRVIPVHSSGGWAQLALFPASRVTLHFYGGVQRDRAADLLNGNIPRNFTYAGNLFYRIAPNILGSFEASQTRTNRLNIGERINNHYDLALAYLF